MLVIDCHETETARCLSEAGVRFRPMMTAHCGTSQTEARRNEADRPRFARMAPGGSEPIFHRYETFLIIPHTYISYQSCDFFDTRCW